MPNELRHRNGEGFSHKFIDASSSSGAHTEFDLVAPVKDWSLQVATASTDAIITLDLSLQSSSGATFEPKLTWATTAGQADGDIVSLTDTPGRMARATLEAGASSNGASAWVGGV